jgi:hypothetical protein
MLQGISFAATLQEAVIKPPHNVADGLRRALSEPAGTDALVTRQQQVREHCRLARQLRTHMRLLPNDFLHDALQRHRGTLLYLLTRIDAFAKPEINHRERT